MRNKSVAFELTDGEIRAFWFSVPSLPSFRERGHNSAKVKLDRIPIPTGLIEQGNVRDENALINILVTYKAQCSGKSQKAYLAIPLQQGFIRSYTLPWISKRDREAAISLLIDGEISIARSDLLFDFFVSSEEKPEKIQILLGATRQSLLDSYVYIFERAGFEVKGVDFAFSILGQTLEFELDEDVLFLQRESESLQMVLFRGKVPESVRSLHPIQRSIPLSSAEGSDETSDDPMEEWEKEIRRSILYYRAQYSDFNLRRIVWRGDSVVEFLGQSLLASNLVTKVEQVKLKNVPDSWQEILGKNSGWSEVIVGYGREISAHHSQLNLWRQPNKDRVLLRRHRGLAFFALALFIGGTAIWFFLKQKILPLQLEVQQISRQGSSIVAQANQQKDLVTAWEKATAQSDKVGYSLRQIKSLSVIADNEIEIEQMVYKQGSISLRGSTEEAGSVETLIQSLRALGWVEPSLTSYRLTSGKNIEFVLNAKRGKVSQDSGNRSENSAEDSTIEGTSLGEGG